MFYIYCPHCCEHREEEEFHAAGQAHIPRPLDPDACTDKEWGEYMYFRKNPRGIHHELWVHSAGCRKFFNITRDTQTYEIKEVYKIGEKPSVVANAVEVQNSHTQNSSKTPLENTLESQSGATL